MPRTTLAPPTWPWTCCWTWHTRPCTCTALRLVQLASATAANREHPVSTITQGYISAVLGWCRVALGEAEPTRRAIGNAQDTYAAADPATTPPWAGFVNVAEITAQQGHSLYLLLLTRLEFAPRGHRETDHRRHRLRRGVRTQPRDDPPPTRLGAVPGR
ncbi:MAG TPA: hypothetical protein VFQ77_09995 [Pseudonocardiaceae bacterium]|nr:hypothetical protein [Pseudonocardiaceae bacterium]